MSSVASGYVDVTSGAVEYCETMAKEFPGELADTYYDPVGTYMKQKLWHQLTVKILDFVNDPKVISIVSGVPLSSSSGGDGRSSTPPPMTATVSESYLGLYDKVVLTVDSKLHPLSLARIASSVATALSTHDMTAAKALLENLLDKLKNQQQQQMEQSQGGGSGGGGGRHNAQSSVNTDPSLRAAAIIYLQSKHSLLALQPFLTGAEAAAAGDTTTTSETPSTTTTSLLSENSVLSSIKSIIVENAAKLDEMQMPTSNIAGKDDSGAALVYAAHYEQSMSYYKVVGPPEAFYEQAMSFLNYADFCKFIDKSGAGGDASGAASSSSSGTATVTTTTDFYQLAIDLCLAALTGQGVYNLGQVEQTPILQLLKQPPLPGQEPQEWLVHLLKACAAGDVTQFYQFSQQYATQIASQPALVQRSTAVQEKLKLLAFTHLVFEKPSAERTLTFDEIAMRLQVTLDQVDWVVMRALSVGLIQGSIDQVDQTVQVTWVMPRVLTAPQMTDLATRFGEWATKVSTAKEYMQQQTPTFA